MRYIRTFFYALVMDSAEVVAEILHVFQVAKLVRLFRHKLRLENAYFKAQDFDAIQVLSAHFRNKNPRYTSGTRTPRHTLYQYNIIYDIVSDIIPDVGYHVVFLAYFSFAKQSLTISALTSSSSLKERKCITHAL